MESKAIAKFQRVSPRKTRLVASNVKGLPVEEALNQLKFTPNKPAGVLFAVVRSALANAAQFPGIDVDSMYVKDVVVNEGARDAHPQAHQPHHRHSRGRAGISYGSESTSLRLPAGLQ